MYTSELEMFTIIFLFFGLIVYCLLDHHHKAKLNQLFLVIQSCILGYSQIIWDSLIKKEELPKKNVSKHGKPKKQRRKVRRHTNMKINTSVGLDTEGENTELNAAENLDAYDKNYLSDFGKNSTAENSPRIACCVEDETVNEMVINEEEFFIDTYKSDFGLFSGPCIERMSMEALIYDSQGRREDFN
ncbi:unnamed protein product [Blepharisma stoltei]|uniref:Uncharacterized protein n=1 Tax=Blepharisma stoltei TaxID=1481888 RepID=A0AAU9KCZ7_9CILI|nr:unnamed protein product [Blepharisma stoltei]